MARFNPFAKNKSEKEVIIEEVELMPDDSISYFEEKLQGKQEKERELASKIREKQRDLQSIGFNLEAEQQKRQTKKAEIDNKLEVLKQQQREIAQNIVLENGDSKKLEEELHKISVVILSEQAKATAYEAEAKLYLPTNIKQDLKHRINEYEQAIENYRVEKSITDLQKEIREVINSLQKLEEDINRFSGQKERIETVETLLKPYIGYFISQKDLETIFGNENQHLAENYFAVWINDDSSQDFNQYAYRLNHL